MKLIDCGFKYIPMVQMLRHIFFVLSIYYHHYHDHYLKLVTTVVAKS